MANKSKTGRVMVLAPFAALVLIAMFGVFSSMYARIRGVPSTATGDEQRTCVQAAITLTQELDETLVRYVTGQPLDIGRGSNTPNADIGRRVAQELRVFNRWRSAFRDRLLAARGSCTEPQKAGEKSQNSNNRLYDQLSETFEHASQSVEQHLGLRAGLLSAIRGSAAAATATPH